MSKTSTSTNNNTDIEKRLRLFLKKAKKPLIVILGPTASGKTALSLKLAHDFNGEIISTDSRQIYKEMDIGTDAILPSQQEGIPHHLLAIAKPDKTITTAEYTELALEKIKEIYKRKHVPILVGGTGLYISSIIFSYQIPRVPPDEKLRAKLYKEAEKKGNEFVHAKLAKLDPEAAKKIHPNNLRYVVRALEINMTTGENKIDVQKKSPFDTFLIGLNWPREKLYERVNLRVDLQLKRGLLDEVKTLLKKGYKEDSPAMSSLGVKEIIPYLKGKATLDECIEVLKKNTRNYAKRQMTWFRRYDKVHWLNMD